MKAPVKQTEKKTILVVQAWYSNRPTFNEKTFDLHLFDIRLFLSTLSIGHSVEIDSQGHRSVFGVAR